MIAPHTDPPDPAVIPDCPSWCRMAAGHMYGSFSDTGRGVSREHDNNPHCLLASACQRETFEDGRVSLDAPFVWIVPPEVDIAKLTPAEARARAVAEGERAQAVVAELQEAAALVERLTAEAQQ